MMALDAPAKPLRSVWQPCQDRSSRHDNGHLSSLWSQSHAVAPLRRHEMCSKGPNRSKV
jgi:hypothetical protein